MSLFYFAYATAFGMFDSVYQPDFLLSSLCFCSFITCQYLVHTVFSPLLRLHFYNTEMTINPIYIHIPILNRFQ